MSDTYNAAAANEDNAYSELGPNYPPVWPSMQSPDEPGELSDLVHDRSGRLFSSADATRARVALFERVDEIYKDEKNILAARAKAEQRTNKKSAEYRSEFNAEEVLQRKTYFIPTEDGIFRETLKVQFQDWWATRNEVFKGIVQDKEPVFKAAQQLNKQKPKDQQEKVNADWVFHKQCICWEFLRFWLDDQSEKLRQKSELRNDDRYRRAEYVKFFTDSLFGIVVREPL